MANPTRQFRQGASSDKNSRRGLSRRKSLIFRRPRELPKSNSGEIPILSNQIVPSSLELPFRLNVKPTPKDCSGRSRVGWGQTFSKTAFRGNETSLPHWNGHFASANAHSTGFVCEISVSSRRNVPSTLEWTFRLGETRILQASNPLKSRSQRGGGLAYIHIYISTRE